MRKVDNKVKAKISGLVFLFAMVCLSTQSAHALDSKLYCRGQGGLSSKELSALAAKSLTKQGYTKFRVYVSQVADGRDPAISRPSSSLTEDSFLVEKGEGTGCTTKSDGTTSCKHGAKVTLVDSPTPLVPCTISRKLTIKVSVSGAPTISNTQTVEYPGIYVLPAKPRNDTGNASK